MVLIMRFGVSGKTLLNRQAKGAGKEAEIIDLKDFAPGVYVAYARTGGKVWGAQKFVVSK